MTVGALDVENMAGERTGLTNTPMIMQKTLNMYTMEEKRNRNFEGSFRLISSGTTNPTPSNM